MSGWNKEQFKKYDTSEGFGGRRSWQQAFNQRISPEEAKEILQDESPWAILGVKESATQAEIKTAYRKLMQQWHPDLNAHREAEATEMCKKINAAYSILRKN